jgi:hypothetical protein
MGTLLGHEGQIPPANNLNHLLEEIEKQPQRLDLIEHVRMFVRRSQVEMLDGQCRLSLVDARPMGNLKLAVTNNLQALFRDDSKRRVLSQLTKEAFGLYFVIDPTDAGQLKVAMSREPPATADEERSLANSAIAFFDRAIPIIEMSDGVKAYTGILAAVLSSNLRVILRDEPDAFLHPPLAHRLGKTLTRVASERQGNLFASTHDPNFLWGCVQAGKPINIVRLTYRDQAATARLLSALQIGQIMSDPLLRSTRILESLFHEGAIVCEADADRAFYQEANQRLLGANRDDAADCMFLNAQNKQTLRRIIGPLRAMGIPAATIKRPISSRTTAANGRAPSCSTCRTHRRFRRSLSPGFWRSTQKSRCARS